MFGIVSIFTGFPKQKEGYLTVVRLVIIIIILLKIFPFMSFISIVIYNKYLYALSWLMWNGVNAIYYRSLCKLLQKIDRHSLGIF